MRVCTWNSNQGTYMEAYRNTFLGIAARFMSMPPGFAWRMVWGDFQ